MIGPSSGSARILGGDQKLINYSDRKGQERVFYLAMAALLVIVAVIGFTPNTAAILSGEKENPPLIIHLHAAAMAAWLIALLAQSVLATARLLTEHRQVGIALFVTAPVVLILMLLISFQIFDSDQLAESANNARRILIYTFFVVWAILSVGRDRTTHQRCILVATIVLMDAAFFRIHWLPWYGTDMLMVHVYQSLLIVPLIVFDVVVLGRVHRATLLGSIALVLSMLAVASV